MDRQAVHGPISETFYCDKRKEVGEPRSIEMTQQHDESLKTRIFA